MKTSSSKIAAENWSTNNQAYPIVLERIAKSLIYRRREGVEAVKFICCATVRRVRLVRREGNNNDTYRERTVAVSAGIQYTYDTHATRMNFPPCSRVLHGSHYFVWVTLYPVYRSMLSVVGVSALYEGRVSNFYHDLIDRFSMSGALFFVFLDSRARTIVTEWRRDERRTRSFSLPSPPSSPSLLPPLRAMVYTFMLICS